MQLCMLRELNRLSNIRSDSVLFCVAETLCLFRAELYKANTLIRELLGLALQFRNMPGSGSPTSKKLHHSVSSHGFYSTLICNMVQTLRIPQKHSQCSVNKTLPARNTVASTTTAAAAAAVTKLCRSSTLLAKSQVQKFTGMKCRELPKSLLSSLQTSSVSDSEPCWHGGNQRGNKRCQFKVTWPFDFVTCQGLARRSGDMSASRTRFNVLLAGVHCWKRWWHWGGLKARKTALLLFLIFLLLHLLSWPCHHTHLFFFFFFVCHPSRLSPEPEHQAERRVSMEHDWETGSHLVSLYISLCSDWHWRWAWQAPHFPQSNPPVPEDGKEKHSLSFIHEAPSKRFVFQITHTMGKK